MAMKRHMTQMELTKTRRLIEKGITDIAEIQTYIFCHEDNIRKVLEGYDVEIPEPPKAPVKKAPAKRAAKKSPKGGAAARAAAKESEKVDPIS